MYAGRCGQSNSTLGLLVHVESGIGRILCDGGLGSELLTHPHRSRNSHHFSTSEFAHSSRFRGIEQDHAKPCDIRDDSHPGLIVESRGGKWRVRVNGSLRRGKVLVLEDAGTKVLDLGGKDCDLLVKVLGLLKSLIPTNQ